MTRKPVACCYRCLKGTRMPVCQVAEYYPGGVRWETGHLCRACLPIMRGLNRWREYSHSNLQSGKVAE